MQPARALFERVLVIALGCMTVALTLAHIVGISAIARAASASPSYVSLQFGFAVFAIGAALLGIVIAAKTPTGNGQLLIALSFVIMGLPVLEDGLTANETFAGIANPIAGAALMTTLAAALRASQLFPSRLEKSSITAEAYGRRRVVHALLQPVAWVQQALLTPHVLLVMTLVVALIFATGVLVVTPTLGAVATIGVSILILANLRAGYVAANAEQRRQVYWLSLGMIVVLVVGLLTASLALLELTSGWRLPIALWPYWLGLVGLFAGLCVTAFAILYKGALDPVLAIQRTLLYGGLVIVMVFLFSGLENLLTNYVVESLGFPSGWGAWIAGGLVALVLAPMHETLARRIRAREVKSVRAE